jgi:2,3-bisphosphoglycerate-dependent phosphoglycerate mutase
MRCEVILVRHAEPSLPQPDGPDDFHRALTTRGRAQAERLVAELVGFRPRAVVSSPYLRAVQTVEPAARELGMLVATDLALREWDSGLEPGPDFADHYAKSWADPAFARPGGESLAALTERAVRAVRLLATEMDGGPVVVGSHGTFISRLLAGFGVAVDWPFSRTMPMPAIYRLSLTHEGCHAVGPGLLTGNPIGTQRKGARQTMAGWDRAGSDAPRTTSL